MASTLTGWPSLDDSGSARSRLVPDVDPDQVLQSVLPLDGC